MRRSISQNRPCRRFGVLLIILFHGSEDFCDFLVRFPKEFVGLPSGSVLDVSSLLELAAHILHLHPSSDKVLINATNNFLRHSIRRFRFDCGALTSLLMSVLLSKRVTSTKEENNVFAQTVLEELLLLLKEKVIADERTVAAIIQVGDVLTT